KAGVLDQDQRTLVGIVQARGDADALVLLAHADEAQRLVICDRTQQAGAGDDIGHRQHEFHAALFNGGQDVRAVEFNLGLFGRLGTNSDAPPSAPLFLTLARLGKENAGARTPTGPRPARSPVLPRSMGPAFLSRPRHTGLLHDLGPARGLSL